MDTSYFLAQVLGIYFIIASVATLWHPKIISDVIRTFQQDRGSIFIWGMLILAFGIPLILIHNIWSGALWQTLITLVAWLVFLKGAMFVLLPEATTRLSGSFLANQNAVKIPLILMAILGLYFLYVGFGFGG